jgi:hypothetical protein
MALIGLKKIYIIQGIVLLSSTENSQAHCPTDSSYFIISPFFENLKKSAVTEIVIFQVWLGVFTPYLPVPCDQEGYTTQLFCVFLHVISTIRGR